MNETPNVLSHLGALVVWPSIGQLCDDCWNDLQSGESEQADSNPVIRSYALRRLEQLRQKKSR